MTSETSREERLAAQLRANLKRRKTQARTLSGRSDLAEAGESPDLPKSDTGG